MTTFLVLAAVSFAVWIWWQARKYDRTHIEPAPTVPVATRPHRLNMTRASLRRVKWIVECDCGLWKPCMTDNEALDAWNQHATDPNVLEASL